MYIYIYEGRKKGREKGKGKREGEREGKKGREKGKGKTEGRFPIAAYYSLERSPAPAGHAARRRRTDGVRREI